MEHKYSISKEEKEVTFNLKDVNYANIISSLNKKERGIEKVIYSGGTFDCLHFGHLNFLKQCKNIAQRGKVVIALNTDEFIEEYKKVKPLFSYNERRKLLLKCDYVNEVIPNVGGKDSKITINQVDPDYIVIGTDWAKKDYYKQMDFTQDWLDEKNIVLIYIPYTEGISTSVIKERVKHQK